MSLRDVLYEARRERERRERNDTVRKIAVGTIVGSIIGVASGLLFAPKSGKETREDLQQFTRDTTEEVKLRAGEMYDSLREKEAQLRTDIQSKYESFVDRNMTDLSPVKEDLGNIKEDVGSLFQNTKEIAKQKIADLRDGAKDAKENVEDAAEDLADKAKDVKEDLKDKAKDLKDDVKDKAEDVKEAAEDKAAKAAEKVGDAAHKVGDAAHKAADKL